jgi:hypothetical protein
MLLDAQRTSGHPRGPCPALPLMRSPTASGTQCEANNTSVLNRVAARDSLPDAYAALPAQLNDHQELSAASRTPITAAHQRRARPD